MRSIQYGSALAIQGGEWKRYLKKSISFGLCYAGLGNKISSREAWNAGEAAFLCCAYDVVTDWRCFDRESRRVFEEILRAMVPSVELQNLAIGLYEKEQSHKLEDNGLDRGSIALRFVLGKMQCEADRDAAWGDIDKIGRLLQIVDDVLDYEEDVVRGETNCLSSSRREIYLTQLLKELSDDAVNRLFGNNNSILVRVIIRAKQKAETFLTKEGFLQEDANVVSAKKGPICASSSTHPIEANK
ncbi:MAG: hypothetical protein JXA73_11350 [Acidobacteria bacterium]|nr:hypothetical protein [Acidobacteriota bacterium]